MTAGTNNLPGPGPGRPKGVIPIKSVRQMLDAVGFNPFHKAVEMIRDPTTTVSTRASLTQSLMPYYGHRLNAIEITGKDGEALVPTVQVVFPKKDE